MLGDPLGDLLLVSGDDSGQVGLLRLVDVALSGQETGIVAHGLLGVVESPDPGTGRSRHDLAGLGVHRRRRRSLGYGQVVSDVSALLSPAQHLEDLYLALVLLAGLDEGDKGVHVSVVGIHNASYI